MKALGFDLVVLKGAKCKEFHMINDDEFLCVNRKQ